MSEQTRIALERRGRLEASVMLRADGPSLMRYRSMSADEQLSLVRSGDPMIIAPVAATTVHEEVVRQLVVHPDYAVRGALAVYNGIDREMMVGLSNKLRAMVLKSDVVEGDKKLGRLGKLIYLDVTQTALYPFLGIGRSDHN